jgi:hypothetical protein
MVSTTSLKILFFFFFFLTVLTVKIVEGAPQIIPACVGLPDCQGCFCVCTVYEGKSQQECEQICAPECD